MEGFETRDIVRIHERGASREGDYVANEDALSIAISSPEFGSYNLGVTMRTRGDDSNLVLGFLYSEGVISSFDEVGMIDSGDDVVSVSLVEGTAFDPSVHCRPSTVSSSCGICGRSTIDDALNMHGGTCLDDRARVSLSTISTCLDQMSSSQTLFSNTGGTHACASFDSEGSIQRIFEDVGRHNAMDKLVGSFFSEGALPADGMICLVSGRASFELVHKSIRAGFPILVAIGAPSTLAVDLAKEHGQTLICFARSNALTVYSGLRRVVQ